MSAVAPPLTIINGTFAGCSGNASCTGWAFTPATYGSNFNFNGTNPNAANFGGTTATYYDQISQGVTTTAGSIYTFDFDLSNLLGVSPGNADFKVTWNGTVIYDNAGRTAFGPTAISVTTGPATGTDVLAFQGYQLGSWFELSNVGNATVPEPSMLALLIPALGFVEVLRRKLSR